MKANEIKAVQELDTNDKWPEDGLEWLGCCPVCGAKERSVLHDDLKDCVFFCAPGKWTLYLCQSCGSGYLDPRPTRESIGLAYRRYFTHVLNTPQSTSELSWLHLIRRALANGYRNHRFGTRQRPASYLGVLAAMLLPSQRSVLESERRHLPRPSPGAQLLDVGCGNGDFLDFAHRAGWRVVGVELDSKAAETARSRGLDVRLGGVDVLDTEKERFDGITLSHIIEHVHDPLEVLHTCHHLLKPGGWIWLETPNLEAQGHMRYGTSWRGLEPPRHLILFTCASLTHALREAGFQSIQIQSYRPQCKHLWGASEAIRQGRDPYQFPELHGEDSRFAQHADYVARHNPGVREFITLKVSKAQ
jgi:2-polyprenyl-3-methyl-5-hydroxy-6-metoxy-1,4-benzoquinol methylase